MAPLSLKIVQDDGAVTRTVKFESTTRVDEAQALVREKILTAHDGKDYGLFLTSADDEKSGIWLERHRQLDYYMLRDGDQLHYLCKLRNLRVRMLDGAVKTLQVDEAKTVEELMVGICGRLGITNHDEYGLCHDGEEEQDENKVGPGAGTLTRRVAHQKERDAKMQQLSKKLKTDDNVEWLDQHKTLRELRVDPKSTVLLKRRLFFSDRNVDARDPVQLNLLYVQARDAILEGRHPVTEDQAVEFAGIQCQIHYGDFQEEKHKPGLIENLSEYLPEQYSSSWGIEKKILKEFSKHQGLSQIEAKFLYTKTARDLPTYGVTFFLVKEKQKGKKKLVPRLLGINAESILRLDEVTKEILQVWPLTQVKTYHAGMSETFTLNFGDYSDKEYSVKTNDAHRIRDILQGYIDIIRKRMEANYNLNQTEYHAICEDNVHASRGNIMERIEHKPTKIVEESFVGPSQIFTYEPGKAIAQGTQIVTVQQLVVNANKRNNQQNAMVEEEKIDHLRNLRSEQQEFGRKLIRLNSNSVQIVTLLSEPSQANLSEATKIVNNMEANMPSIAEAIKIRAENETNEQTKQKLLERLQELSDCMKALSEYIVDGQAKEAQEAGKRVADLSIQMCSAFDPGMVKKKEFCRRSRKSFIEDEHLDATLRRASFLAAAQTASGTIDGVKLNLHKEYQGQPLDAAQVEELEKSAADKMAKLNAAVALNLTAYTDPNNIDYAAAVTSMNSINELLPGLAKDAKALSSVNDGKNREELLDAIRALCDSLKAVCSEDALHSHKEMELAAKDYAQKSGKLLFTFRRGNEPNADKEKEILLASHDVEVATKDLVDRSKRLAKKAQHEGMQEVAHSVFTASYQCSIAATDVHICAQLTASAIHEPHCRSALKAASETLSSSAKHLAFTCKPMLQHVDDKEVTNDLKQKFLDLAAALDRLKDTYAGFEEESPDEVKAKRKVKFITSVAEAKKKMNEAEDELNKPLMEPSTQEEATKQELQRRLGQRMAQLNAALAALVAATADRDNQDYETAELAVSTIAELMPDIVRDGKLVSAQSDPATREQLLEDLRALCEATKDICHTTDSGNLDDINKQASKVAKSSGKLIFMFKPHRKQDNEKQIVGISSSANEKAAQLMAGVEELLQQVGPGTELYTANRRLADAARALDTATQLTAPCIEDPRCQESLVSAADAVSAADQNLAAVMMPLVKDPRYKPMGDKLEAQRLLLEQELDRLRKACRDIGAGGAAIDGKKSKEAVRLQFTKGGAQLAVAHKLLDKPTVPLKSNIPVEDLRKKLADDINRLNAAVAALVAATADRENPDFEATEEAINTINQLLPQVITDTKTLSSMEDEPTRAAMLADLRALCGATEDIFNSPENPNQDLNKAAVKFGVVSGRLVYVFDPRTDQNSEHTIEGISSSANEKAAQLMAGVEELLQQVGPGTELDTANRRLADAARALDTTTQLTAPRIKDPRCQESLISAADAVSAADQNLAAVMMPLVKDPRHKPMGDKLEAQRLLLEQELDRLRKACRDIGAGGAAIDGQKRKEVVRLQFKKGGAQISAAHKLLDKPTVPLKSNIPVEDLRKKLADDINRLNAEVAALVAATADRENPDCEATEEAINTINQLLPQVITDTKTLSSMEDEATRAAMLADLRALCDATADIFNSPEHQDLNKAAVKFGAVSGRLVYVFDPRADQDREHTVLDLSSSACEKASALLSGVYQLATEVGGEPGTELDNAGSKVADGANILLTTAQLTSPCIQDPSCRSKLLSSADVLETASQNLASIWKPIVQNPKHSALGDTLKNYQGQLEEELEKLRKACQIADSELQTKLVSKPVNEKQQLQFVATVTALDNNLRLLEKELDDPLPPSQVPVPASLQNKLAQSLAQLNAAIAALLAATSDRESPDYVKADQAIQEINQIMPHIVKDMRVVGASKDPQTRDLMMSDLRATCDAVRALCSDAHTQSNELGRNEQAAILADKCSKLYYVVSPRVDQIKEHEIIDLTTDVCQKAAMLLSGVHQLASAVQGEEGTNLDVAGARTADAADTLLATAQLTAASIHEPASRIALLSSTDDVASTVATLSSTWEPIVKNPVHAAASVQLREHKAQLEAALEKLRAAIMEDRGAFKSPTRKAPPPPPKRLTSYTPPAPSVTDVTQHFLDALREDEARAASEVRAAAERKKLEEEKAQQQKLISSVDSAVQRVQKSGELLTKLYSSESEVIPSLSLEQTAVVQKQMEHKLAAANVAAAKLVNAQHLNELDYAAACEPTAALADIIPHIVQDAKLLRGALDEEEKKSFLEDVLAMFDATKVLLGAAKNDHRNINESAVVFGNKTAKLLYVVSTDVDPAQEKEVFVQARGIGDSASRLAVLAAEKGGAGVDQQFAELCARGGACADAAGTMLYTTKLVAPCIQVSECQQTLTKATDDLSQLVQQYSDTWGAIQSDPITKQELQKETQKLHQMLKTFKDDVQSGRFVKRRPVERIAVQNTPLRQLACAILEDAQKRATQSTLPPEQRAAYVKYGAQLGRAIKQMDIAYHHSQNAPHDLDKRLQLENAVQELQVAILMQRPTSDAPQSNVVDLTDYVRAAKEDADILSKGCNELPELQMVKEHCERINEYAARTMNPELYEQNPGESTTDDRRDVVQFAEECDKRVRAINSLLQSLEDGKVKIDLRDKAARLAESTNLLNFATKCDLATTQSVSLDATLEELTDLEKKIDEMLVAGGKRLIPNKNASWSQSGRGRLITAASRTGTTATNSLVPAYAAYVDDVRVGGDLSDPAYKKGSKEHLMKVLRLLKTLTMTNSRHVATWQSPNQPETAVITEQIIKELENNNASAVDGGQKSVLNEVDISKLLLPTQSKIQVDPKQLPEKLNQAASKLSCSVGTLVQSANKPTSLARTVPSVYEAAMTLATIARHAPAKDIAHSQKIDEASKEMSIQTYNVLKTAESVSQEPNNYATRRKFLDACNRLNDAISILVRSAVPSDKLHKECAVSLYRAQQQGVGAVAGWCCALGYPHILPALQNQRDVLEKLNGETHQSREEFSRSVAHVTAAVDSSSQYAAHAAYLLSIADQHNELATEGFIDVGRIQSLSEAVQESCHRVMMTEADQAKEEAPILIKQIQDFQKAVTEAQDKVKDEKDKNELKESNIELEESVKELNTIVHEKTLNKGRLATITIRILELTRWIIYIIERISIIPEIKEVSVEAKARSDDVLKNCRNLNTKMLALIREVKTSEDQDPMTWVTFGTRKAVLEMFEALMNSVQENGKRAGILEPSQSDLDEEQKKRSFVQVQLDLANKWLARPAVKPEVKTAGEQAARTIISLGEKISEDLKGQEKEEIQDLVTSSEELLADCLKKPDTEKARLLMERLKALRKAIERCVVARIVDDFLEGEEPLADLDILCDAETDEEKRKFLLERKIAELLAHLGRVTKTARVAARAGNGTEGVNEQLVKCSEQTELLAPMLVQAAQKRVVSPDDQAAIAHYQKLLAQYADSLANLRGLCDQAVDPMDFVQTAGETMQRLREDTTNDNDPQKCAYASTAITKLANRVITVSMSSSDVRKDPELQKALKEAKERLKAVVPGPNARPSRIPDWKVTTAEILRTTGEVESVLGGEMIFKKQQTSDEPIFAAAYDLHTAIRSWSAKDNEIVAVAKRMAVLMAKLADFMHTDRKRDVIVTAKAIVSESREVAELARKLAHECSDVRIKTNLLQICERIPTISGQLKMLATVKGSLGHQGLKEDQEDMNMLVGNAQNLMLSVQEAVNAAASASVKIMSQRGGSRMRWVRKSYY